ALVCLLLNISPINLYETPTMRTTTILFNLALWMIKSVEYFFLLVLGLVDERTLTIKPAKERMMNRCIHLAVLQSKKRRNIEPVDDSSGSSIQEKSEHRTGGFLSSSSNWKKSKN